MNTSAVVSGHHKPQGSSRSLGQPKGRNVYMKVQL